MPAAEITKSELFSSLTRGHAAGITVVTPNRRLAQVLKAEFDAAQAASGLAAWEEADILPLDAFVVRCYEDALYADGGAELPLLLAPAQSRELWEEAIAASRWADALLDVPGTAARAMDAWSLAHKWNIAGTLEKFAANEDTQAFAEWARAYARRLKQDHLVDAATLPALGLKAPKTKLLVAYAFDIVPAQAKDFLKHFEVLNCQPERKQSRPGKISFTSPRDELEAAAKWARARLEEGKTRVGVVVPELELRRRVVARVFRRVMGSPLPFELSIGEPLADYPVVAFALALIEFSLHEIEFEAASRLIRSPFLGGAEAEMAARARFDAALRGDADARISLPRLIGLVEGCPLLRSQLEKVFALKAGKQSPHDWAQHFTALLHAAGFPGERTPDSAEFQARAKLNELLGEFARLSLVISKISLPKALTQLRRLCAETLFQPEGVGGIGAPVQVLGLLESAGIEFDALWVSGLTDAAWPLRARPNPFLPVGLQKKAGIPEASAEASLALDRRRTEGWACAADEVRFSWARHEEDHDLQPSPLLAAVPEANLELPSFPSYRELIFRARKSETWVDEKAPPLEGAKVRGGTRVLADQAACPFRAFARHRLRAEALQAPEPGPDAMDRGSLLHALMAGIWKELGSSAALAQDLEPVIGRAASNAVKELALEGRFAELEVERLRKLARDWLAVEKERPAFEVVLTEGKRELSAGGLNFSGRIDRMDRFEDGSHAVIDYKTGSVVTPKVWNGARPDDPQLPLYAISAPEPVSALAFAKLRAGDMKFSGFSAAKDAIPGVKTAQSWPGLVSGWKAVLERLAHGYSAGEAAVDPKEGLKTCRRCDLQALCRVAERLSPLASDEEQAG